MLSPEERAVVIDLQDRMIELLVQKEEAERQRDRSRSHQLQTQIDRLKTECRSIREAEESPPGRWQA